jgi:uncharacterized membrane protein YedE/YeeE
MHRSDFCIAGMFRDLFLFKSIFKLRTLLLLVICSMVLFETARQLGLLPLYPFPLFGSPSLANVIGGFLFGIGMVMAGGCVVGTLYKMGAGSVPSMVAFMGLLAGSGLYAEIHPWWSAVIAKTTFQKGKITIPQILNIDPFPFVLITAVLAGFYFLQVHRENGWVRPLYTEGALQPWKAAILLAIIGLLSAVAIGMPLGITTAYAKMAGCLESFLIPRHFQNLAFFKALPLNYCHPLTGTQLVGGPGPNMDAIAAIQLPLIGGILMGGACSALLLREFRVYFRIPLRQYLSAIIGGTIMGLASRMAPACNIWHLFGGLPILAVQSILFLAGLFPGAWLGSLILSRVIVRAE